MNAFAVYQLKNMITGQSLYNTTATEAEIRQANLNLSIQQLSTRFVLRNSSPEYAAQ